MSVKFLTRNEASNYLLTTYGIPISPKTLAKLATLGNGPIYQKFGHRVLYTCDNLDNWVSQKLSKPRLNTSCEA